MRWAIATIASGALCLAGLLYPNLEEHWFIDEDYLFEHGSALSVAYLKEHTPEFAKRLEELQQWVVRIEVQHSASEGAYSSNHGTGILLGDSQILTAKHVLHENVTGEISKILLTQPNGRVLRAEVDRQGTEDWTLLRILLAEGAPALNNSPIELGKATEGETAIFFGYPAMVGLSAEGEVLPFRKGDAQTESAGSALAPMLVVGSVLDAKAMTLAPLAGFPPVGGMSGGPVLNSKGQVIGVQVSVSKTTDNQTGRTLHYRLNAVPASAVPASAVER
jgi:S1-C subfamily serine protease